MRWMIQVFLMESRKLITYRADFWVNFLGLTFFALTIAYYLWDSIFTSANKEIMSGFTMQSMIFYYLSIPLIYRIQQGQGIGFISREIYDGSLNKYLLYPINIYQFKQATYLAVSFFYLIQFFIVMLIYNIFFYNSDVYQFNILNILTFIFVVFISTFLFFYLFTLCEFMAFWFDNIWSLAVILRFITSFLGGAFIPLVFFPDWTQGLLQYTPFPYLIDFPFRVFVGKMEFSLILKNLLISCIWLFVFRFLSKIIWKKGQYKYTGVGI